MVIALIDLETDEVLDLKDVHPDDAGMFNAAAQEMDESLEWRPLTPYEIGLIIGQTLPVLAALAREN